ncbi:GatB/YqeY domain-containing protein, partial [Enterococcus faecalis]|uniref:GatB/YqeY domain-containing protein n=1 Tax=Enterococcus faecalis TaxID=1351 RepID=UPI0025B07E54
MLIKQIKSDQEDARRAKAGLTATLLTTLIGEAMMVAKNDQREAPTDDEVKEVIGRFVKGIRDTRAALEMAGTPADDPRLVTLEEERLVLVRYLPQQLTE